MVRPAVLVLTLLTAASLLTGCDSSFEGLHVRLATGSAQGVYYALGRPLAAQWATQLGIDRPQVQESQGSPENVKRLRTGTADVAFCAADVAEEDTEKGPRKLRALARVYDDYIHLVVRANGPIKSVQQLRGRRVSIGSPDSGVEVIAKRVLSVMTLSNAVIKTHMSLDDSVRALEKDDIDAFFWSGGLPTTGITKLADDIPIRLVDLSPVLPGIHDQYPIYGTASIPASTYPRLPGGPVTTLVVPNFLMVTDAMPADEARELVRGVFLAQDQLVKASDAALSIDIHSAIDTAPVPLHPGALEYYRDAKV